MSQIGEKVSVIVAKGYNKNKCPFCGEDEHDFPSKKDEPTEAVVSIPEHLKCHMSGGKRDRRGNDSCALGQYAYTFAKHHLISAKQCYAKVKPLVRMASSVEYDVNAPPNGIGLPTTHFSLKYPDAGGSKYGSLSQPNKTVVANALMKELGAQWHVGHHSFVYNIPFEDQKSSPASENWGDEVDDLVQVGHQTGYDSQIILKLLDLMLLLFDPDAPICKEDDVSEDIKKRLDDISEEIRKDLEKFQTSEPWQSKLYVSQKAYGYATDLRKGSLARTSSSANLASDDEPSPASASRPAKRARR